MKSDKILVWALLFLLIVVNVVLIVRILRFKTEIELKDQAIEKMGTSQYLADNIATNLNINFRYGGSSVAAIEIKDSEEGRCELREIIRKPTLVFRYSSMACSECISFAANKLSQEFADAGVPVVFLTLYPSIYEMKKWGQTVNSAGFPMFHVEKMLDLDEQVVPYFCVVDESSDVHDIFIPEKLCPSTTTRYLTYMKKKYSNL